jgi:hypothetical protein
LEFVNYSKDSVCTTVVYSNILVAQALDLTFSIDLCAEEGGGNVELVPNGRKTI